MKKKLLKICMPVLIFLVAVVGISLLKKEENEDFEKEEIILKNFRFADGLWHTDKYSYKYKLKLQGKLPEAEEEIIFIVLSNSDSVTFDDVNEKLFGKRKDYNEKEFVLAEIKKQEY